MRRRRVVGVDLCRITHLCQDLPPSPLPFIRPSDVCAAAISEPRAWRQGAKLPPTTATAGSTCGLRRQSSAQSQHAPTLQWSRQHERNLPVDPPVCRDPGHYRSTARNTLAQLHRSRVAGLDLAVFEPPHAVAPLHGRISRKGLEPRRDGARRGGLPSSGRGGWKAKAESEMKAISPTLQTHD
jgi:hypothetical protein